MGALELLLKAFTDGKLVDFIKEFVQNLWDEDMSNDEKKKIVMEKAGELFSQYSMIIISFIVKFAVTQIRLRIEAEEAKNAK